MSSWGFVAEQLGIGWGVEGGGEDGICIATMGHDMTR